MSRNEPSEGFFSRPGKSLVARFLPLAAVLFLSVTGISTAYQDPPPSKRETPQDAADAKRAPIRVSTRLVQASVVVEDRHGQPVTGLKKEDFTILDDEQRQTVAVSRWPPTRRSMRVLPCPRILSATAFPRAKKCPQMLQ